MSGRWGSSNRRTRLPPDWPARRRATLTRDPVCRCRGCPRCMPTGCSSPSTEADHVHAGDNHDELQGMCAPCHAHKSALEGVAARPTRQRPNEPHPGLTNP